MLKFVFGGVKIGRAGWEMVTLLTAECDGRC